MNKCLTTCRDCCKFKKSDIYFLPKFTSRELSILKSKNLSKKAFRHYKNSKKVFQVFPKKSKLNKKIFVCPYLDEHTQKCLIYEYRPFDCAVWPFLFMRGRRKEKNKIFIAHFNKDVCQITKEMSAAEFKRNLKKQLIRWDKKINLDKFISQYPELVWDFEPDTFIVREIKIKHYG